MDDGYRRKRPTRISRTYRHTGIRLEKLNKVRETSVRFFSSEADIHAGDLSKDKSLVLH
jgi:hypothetical protein